MSTGESPSSVWLRQDLRLRDNPALQAAAKRGGAIVPTNAESRRAALAAYQAL
jgi:deoxyribodipyrimidine photolyase